MGTKNGDGEMVPTPFKEESKDDDSVRHHHLKDDLISYANVQFRI